MIPMIENPSEELIEKFNKIPTEELAYSYLSSYIRLQNPTYRFGRHHRMMIKALQKLEDGQISRLIVNCPPRHGKTMLISEYFPAWYLGRNPSNQIIATTYSLDRALDSGRKVRNQMLDTRYIEIFNSAAVPAKDAKAAGKLSTAAGGNFFSVGVGGPIVGRGADIFLIDDPIKGREEAESETARRKLDEWFKGVAYTRLMPEGKIILVMTRWRFDDLSGMLVDEQSNQNWHVIDLPAICDSEDDQLEREIGEALWPSQYSAETLDDIKETVGTREWNAQYQQKPLPSEGGMINIEWFKKYDFVKWIQANTMMRMGAKPGEIIIPFDIKRIVCSWDTAFKEKQLNDPSACTVWGITGDNQFYLLEAFAKRMNYPTLKRKVVSIYEHYMKFGLGQVMVIIEDKASGQSIIQDLTHATRIPIIASEAVLSKQVRMSDVSPLVEGGRCHIPEKAPWLVEYETQMARFPLWKWDDLVDSTSQFLKWAGKPQFKRSKKLKFWK